MFKFIKAILVRESQNPIYDHDEYLSNNLRLIIDSDFKHEPCKGSLELDDYCSGCLYEEEHTGKSKSGRAK